MDFKSIDRRKSKKTSRRILSKPNGSILEDIARNTQGTESFITAHDPPPHHMPQIAELFTQQELEPNQDKDGIKHLIHVLEEASFLLELQAILVKELKHIWVTSMKEATMQSI